MRNNHYFLVAISDIKSVDIKVCVVCSSFDEQRLLCFHEYEPDPPLIDREEGPLGQLPLPQGQLVSPGCTLGREGGLLLLGRAAGEELQEDVPRVEQG